MLAFSKLPGSADVDLEFEMGVPGMCDTSPKAINRADNTGMTTHLRKEVMGSGDDAGGEAGGGDGGGDADGEGM